MVEIISWDKAIDKKVKSVDDQDLGKIQSITKDYIQTKEGLVDKNYYYIPKYYIQGYDGNNLWVSLSKSEVKSRFESENAPNITEFETPDYRSRREALEKKHPDFSVNIPSYTSTSAEHTPDEIALPWEKMIEKKVKSGDKKDLGEIKSISGHYVEIEEGLVSKKRYYIPRYYFQGYDGDSLFVSLTKDDIKQRYERDSPPSESELETIEYKQRNRDIDSRYPQFVHGVPWMAKEPGVSVVSGDTNEVLNIPWENVIHKHVRTTDNIEVGYIERVGNEFIVIRDGVANPHIYYVPKTLIHHYDGSSLHIDVPSGLLGRKFERNDEPTPQEIQQMADEVRRDRLSNPEIKNHDSGRASNESRSVTIEQNIDIEDVSSDKSTNNRNS